MSTTVISFSEYLSDLVAIWDNANHLWYYQMQTKDKKKSLTDKRYKGEEKKDKKKESPDSMK